MGEGALFWNFTVLSLRQGSRRLITVLITHDKMLGAPALFPKEPEITQRWILEHVLKISV